MEIVDHNYNTDSAHLVDLVLGDGTVLQYYPEINQFDCPNKREDFTLTPEIDAQAKALYFDYVAKRGYSFD